MIDVVDTFEAYANSLDWRFSYGNESNKNLLRSDRKDNQIYMILDPVKRDREFSSYGGLKSQSFSGQFLLVVKSTIDAVYHNQTEEQVFARRIELNNGEIHSNSCANFSLIEGKYTKNIQPLLNNDITRLEDLLNCSQYNVTNWQIIDVIDALDVNTDGILVTFTVKI